MSSLNDSYQSMDELNDTVVQVYHAVPTSSPAHSSSTTLPKSVFLPHTREIAFSSATVPNNVNSLLAFDDVDRYMNPLINDMYLVPTPSIQFDEVSILNSTIDDESNVPEVDNVEILNLVTKIPGILAKLTALENRSNHLDEKCSFLTNKCAGLEAKCTNLQSTLASVQKELSEHKSSAAIRFNVGEQYTRCNALLIHNLHEVPRNVHGVHFSRFVAKQLNFHFPSISITHGDIDVSHILYFASPYQQDPVIVCKFVNRDLRNLYFDLRRSNSYRGEVYFSDHLTPLNRELFEKAVKATNKDSVWFAKRKIHASINGVTKVIEQESDLLSVSDPAGTENSNDTPSSSSNTPEDEEPASSEENTSAAQSQQRSNPTDTKRPPHQRSRYYYSSRSQRNFNSKNQNYRGYQPRPTPRQRYNNNHYHRKSNHYHRNNNKNNFTPPHQSFSNNGFHGGIANFSNSNRAFSTPAMSRPAGHQAPTNYLVPPPVGVHGFADPLVRNSNNVPPTLPRPPPGFPPPPSFSLPPGWQMPPNLSGISR